MYFYKNQEQPFIPYSYLNLVKDFRLLMTQLAFLTRSYFASVFSGYGNADAIAQKMYGLPIRFKEKAELIFGTPLSEEFMNLITIYIAYVQNLANALVSGNQAAVDLSVQQLYKNAEDIAVQYSKMNPFWDLTQWRILTNNYSSLLIQDAFALSSRDFEKDLDIFDRMLLSALSMGDYVAEGLFQYITATGRQSTPQ